MKLLERNALVSGGRRPPARLHALIGGDLILAHLSASVNGGLLKRQSKLIRPACSCPLFLLEKLDGDTQIHAL
jgi:hypothetical protein